MSVSNDIREALEAQLLTVATLPSNQDWENVPFTRPSNASWVRVRWQPNTAEGGAMGSSPPILHSGIMLVDVFAPEENGTSAVESIVDDIRAVFEPGQILTAASGQKVVIRRSQRSPGRSDPPFWMIPVTIQWWAQE